MSNLSRRNIVASAAALPVLAVPAFAVPAVTPSADDKAAMVRRAEEVVDLLSTRYIREGWHDSFDKDRAAKFLQDIRRLDIKAEDVDLEQEILAWMREHGQSFDWILVGDKGGMICCLASYAPPPSTEVDPIFAAIEGHRDAHMRRMKTGRVVSRTSSPSREFDAVEAVQDVACDLLSAAEEELARTQPTTMAGVRALLAYVDDFHTQAFALSEDPKNWHSTHEFLPTLVDDEILDRLSGEPIELPFTFWIVRNARMALQSLAVRS
jgi:hypothetical protein